MSSLEWQTAELERLLADSSDAASAKKIELADSLSEHFSVLAAEVERRGLNSDDLRTSAEGFKDFSNQEAQALHDRRRSQALADWLNGKPYAAPST
jgi:hypothetical protein